MIKLAFRPLEMFPAIKAEEVRFNVDWLTRIVSMVCQMTNKSSDDVMLNMSLTEAFSYVVQYCRKDDVKYQIKRRNSDEVNREMYLRTLELGIKYYEENY